MTSDAVTPVLDPCCGSRMFYFDKDDDRVTFCDRYPRHSVLCDGCTLDVEPDMVADFCDLPFPDWSFRLVIFDPPHLDRGHGWQVEKYGVLDEDWHDQLTRGFSECFRVLEPGGTLVFKWYEYSIPLREVLSCTDQKPICGNRKPKQSKTHWLLFMRSGDASCA
jgi:SAM-dependent methyltransferase